MSKTESLRTALKAAIIALGDWTNTYAPEFCDEERIKEAQARLSENGTLYYIATIIQQCRDALKENEMDNLQIDDKVKFVNTGDIRLDNKEAVVQGFYAQDGVIVQPTIKIEGYNPSFAITKYCLTKV